MKVAVVKRVTIDSSPWFFTELISEDGIVDVRLGDTCDDFCRDLIEKGYVIRYQSWLNHKVIFLTTKDY